MSDTLTTVRAPRTPIPLRHLRGPGTRRHVRDEGPCFTGVRGEVAALVDSLP